MKKLNRRRFVSAVSAWQWVVVLGVGCLAFPCGASVVNGDFSSGLSGWTTEGDVQGVSDASLGDDDALYSLLYQGVALSPGTYCIEFDFLNALSSALPTDPLAFPDAFFASLYFSDDLSTFDLAGSVFDGVEPLMDLDFSGPYNVNGVLGASPLGAEWEHFRFQFTNSHAYAIPVFELFNFNGIFSDSEVRVDNVQITECAVVPEPATLTLMAVGLLGVVGGRKLRRG